MKSCILCGKRLGFIKFKSISGYICKSCYEVVSLNFTQTIIDKSLTELRIIYQKAKIPNKDEFNSEFEITRRINQYILFDDKHKILCLPNNSKYSNENLMPEYYMYKDIIQYKVIDAIKEVKSKKLHTIYLEVRFKAGSIVTRQIQLIRKPISPDTSVFKTMKKLAYQIVDELSRLNPVKGY